MVQNCDYTSLVNSYTENIVKGLIPQRILPFDCYEKRKIDSEVKRWIEDGRIDFAVITGDARFCKTNLLCTLATELMRNGKFALIWVNRYEKRLIE